MVSFRYLYTELNTWLWMPRFGKLAIEGTCVVQFSVQKQKLTRMQVTHKKTINHRDILKHFLGISAISVPISLLQHVPNLPQGTEHPLVPRHLLPFCHKVQSGRTWISAEYVSGLIPCQNFAAGRVTALG